MNLSEDQKLIFMKLVEELSELSVELCHAVNKPKKNNFSKILNEINDVEGWILKLKEINNDLKCN